ncbi:MAG: sigma-54-dependent Fis family transcriptional regulator [Planctomycetota bacterium]|nr:MAG: sigma-54-dependent Fis family transcriptional regulator [Planctomycetota bacterium]
MVIDQGLEEVRELLDRMDRWEMPQKQEAATLMRAWADSQGSWRPEGFEKLPAKFGMIGASPAMEEVFGVLARIIRTDVPVLVLGESGTGKELVAKALHQNGPRRKGPMIAVNCAAIPATLLESELFGHVKGAFTGAHRNRKGYAEAADGGTLFLDEIGEMPADMQAKLLRFLQNGEVRPVGGNVAKQVDVRVVAATNRDLLQRVQENAFREDLYYRLAVISIQLPPLRERQGDIPFLVKYLLGVQAEEGMPVAEVSDQAMEALTQARWPGNIRQLQNELVRASAFAKGGRIEVGDLSDSKS